MSPPRFPRTHDVSVTHEVSVAGTVPDPRREDGPHRAPGPSRPRERGALLAVVVAGLAVVVLPRLPAPVGPHAAAAVLAFVALVVESLPFLLVGAVVAAALERVPADRVLALAARHPRLAGAVAPLTGLALPLCDCGLLPLARRFHMAGADASVVNGFVAGAPLANPIVILSTIAAFPGSPGLVVGRVVVGVVVAMLAGAVGPRPRIADGAGCTMEGHHHGNEHASGDEDAGILTAASAELLRMGPTLVLGALAAGTIKALVPTGVFVALGAQPLLGAIGMMLLAFVLAICSQADAFFAASLPVGALPRLAFLLLGPALDVRLAAMYRREFGGRWVLGYAAIVVPAVLALATAWVTWGPS